MARTINESDLMTDEEIATDDRLIIEDVSKPKTLAVTVAELIKRVLRAGTIVADMLADNSVTTRTLDIRIRDDSAVIATGVSSITADYLIREGDVLYGTVFITNSQTISDSTLTFGGIDLSAFGIQTIGQFRGLAYADGGNGSAMVRMNSDGTFNTVDRIPATNIAAGAFFEFTFAVPVLADVPA